MLESGILSVYSENLTKDITVDQIKLFNWWTCLCVY